MSLPPEIALSDEDLNDPLLLPLPVAPVEYHTEDSWEIITDTAESLVTFSLFDVVEWLRVPERRDGIHRVTILRHREGDVK